jgi:hypothetical protein
MPFMGQVRFVHSGMRFDDSAWNKSWYQFRDEALAEIARSWLEEHKFPYK